MPAVRAEGDAVDAGGVPGEGQKLLAAGGVPDLDRVVRASPGEARAVGAEGDLADPAGVFDELCEPPRGPVDRVDFNDVRAGDGDPPPVRTGGHTDDTVPVTPSPHR